jgi:hypothetical protein
MWGRDKRNRRGGRQGVYQRRCGLERSIQRKWASMGKMEDSGIEGLRWWLLLPAIGA